jgi:hypothetical protein
MSLKLVSVSPTFHGNGIDRIHPHLLRIARYTMMIGEEKDDAWRLELHSNPIVVGPIKPTKPISSALLVRFPGWDLKPFIVEFAVPDLCSLAILPER